MLSVKIVKWLTTIVTRDRWVLKKAMVNVFSYNTINEQL